MKKKKAAAGAKKRKTRRSKRVGSRRTPRAHEGSPLALHHQSGHGVSPPVAGRPISVQVRFEVVAPDRGSGPHEVAIYQPHFDGKDWAATLVLPQLQFGPREICGQSPDQAIALAVSVARALYAGKTLQNPDGSAFSWPKHESPLDDLPAKSQTRLVF